MVFNAIFNSISVTSQPVHLSMLFWSSFNQYSAQYSFQATGCFCRKPMLKQRRTVREEWILLQWLSSILGKNIGRARDYTSNLLFSSWQCYQLSYEARHRTWEQGTAGLIPGFAIFFSQDWWYVIWQDLLLCRQRSLFQKLLCGKTANEYCAEYWYNKLQESMDRCTGHLDITEILLKTAIHIIQKSNHALICMQTRVAKQALGFVDWDTQYS